MPIRRKKDREPPPPTPYEAVPVELWLISPMLPRIGGHYKKLPVETIPKRSINEQKRLPEVAAWWKQQDKQENENGHFDGGILYAILESTIKPGQYTYRWMTTTDEDDVAPGLGTFIQNTDPHNPQGVPKPKQPSACHLKKGKCKLDICLEEEHRNKWSCGNPACELPLCRHIITKKKPKLVEPMIWLTQNRLEWDQWSYEWQAAMPDKLWLIAPPRPEQQGEFVKSKSSLKNGCPIWTLDGGQRGYLFSARGGVWVVAGDLEQMRDGVGCVQSDGPHLGKLPQDVTAWRFNAGHGHGWFLHPDIRFITSGDDFERYQTLSGKKFGM